VARASSWECLCLICVVCCEFLKELDVSLKPILFHNNPRFFVTVRGIFNDTNIDTMLRYANFQGFKSLQTFLLPGFSLIARDDRDFIMLQVVNSNNEVVDADEEEREKLLISKSALTVLGVYQEKVSQRVTTHLSEL